ncbi:hypothetical protein ABH926_003719 [Catenulispora sp. GP43]
MKTCISAAAALLAVAGLLAGPYAESTVGTAGSHRAATAGVAPQPARAEDAQPDDSPVPGCLSC